MTNQNLPIVLEGLESLLNTPSLADLGPRRRSGARPVEQLNAEIKSLLGKAPLSQPTRELIRGTLLLWHDHLDEAHAIAQTAENRDGNLLHAIMHRREPDYGNSKYWFRRAGKHPCFASIEAEAASLLGPAYPKLASKLIPVGTWDPLAFVDACEEAVRGASDSHDAPILQAIQRIEFASLLTHLLAD